MSERTLKQLVGALFIVAVLWVAATLISRGGGSIEATGDVAATFQGLDRDSVDAIRFIHGDDTIELVSDPDTWRVNGYRADSGHVARLFDALSEAKVDALVASNPANHARMGVSADSAHTVEFDVNGSVRTVLVGNEGPRVATAYVRLPDQDDVYLLDAALRSHVMRQLDDWRNRKMLAIDTSQVRRIAVERDGDAFTLVRGDSAWAFDNGSRADSSQVQSLLGELAGGLVANGFVSDGDSLAALPPGGSTVAYSQGGDVLAEVTVGSGSGERWAMAAGDSVRYRLPGFRVNLITPTLLSVEPDD